MESVKGLLPDSIQEDWKVVGPYNSTFALVQFSSRKNLFLAIDAMKKQSSPFMWHDDIDEEDKPLFFKKNRSVEEREVRSFQHHFYAGMEALLADGPHGGKDKLLIVSQKLFYKKGDDLMQLLSFIEAHKVKVSPHTKNCSKLGLTAEVVDAMVVAALAAARKE